jgi:hypothetical protein
MFCLNKNVTVGGFDSVPPNQHLTEILSLQMSVEEKAVSVAPKESIKPHTSANTIGLVTEKIEVATDEVENVDNSAETSELEVTYIESKGERINASGDEIVQELVSEIIQTASEKLADDDDKKDLTEEKQLPEVAEDATKEMETAETHVVENLEHEKTEAGEVIPEHSNSIEIEGHDIETVAVPTEEAESKEETSVPEPLEEATKDFDDEKEVSEPVSAPEDVPEVNVHDLPESSRVETVIEQTPAEPPVSSAPVSEEQVAVEKENEIAKEDMKEIVLHSNVEARIQIQIVSTTFSQQQRTCYCCICCDHVCV